MTRERALQRLFAEAIVGPLNNVCASGRVQRRSDPDARLVHGGGRIGMTQMAVLEARHAAYTRVPSAARAPVRTRVSTARTERGHV